MVYVFSAAFPPLHYCISSPNLDSPLFLARTRSLAWHQWPAGVLSQIGGCVRHTHPRSHSELTRNLIISSALRLHPTTEPVQATPTTNME